MPAGKKLPPNEDVEMTDESVPEVAPKVNKVNKRIFLLTDGSVSQPEKVI